MRMRLAVSLVSIVTAGPALANDIEASSTITAVTVYPDAARVTREAKLDLPAGANAVVLRGLPHTLDPASLHVSGGDVSIVSVETRQSERSSKAASPNTAKLKELRDAGAALKVTIAALEAKQAMISRFGETTPASGAGATLSVKDWTAAFDAVGTAHAKTGEELRLANAKLESLDNEIDSLEKDTASDAPAGAQDVIVSIDSVGGAAKFTVEYKVSAARWAPAYEARLDTGGKERKPALELTRRAVVSQQTGEDWTNVPLTVTTLRIQHTAAAPQVRGQQLSLSQPKPAPVASATPAPATGAQRAGAESSRLLWQSPMGPIRFDASMPGPTNKQADLDVDAYQAAYTLAQPVSLASGASEKSFALTTHRMEPELTIRVAPSIDPTGYLQARFKNEDAAPMLPGKMSVIRDGVYVGAAPIAFVSPGEQADIGFGADEKVKVTRLSMAQLEDEPGWLNNSRAKTRDMNTAIKNLHDFPVRVEVRDRVPFAANSEITVEILPQTTRPTNPTAAGRTGVKEWAFDLSPQESKDVRLAWRVRWPADRDLFEPNDYDITSSFRFSGSTNF